MDETTPNPRTAEPVQQKPEWLFLLVSGLFFSMGSLLSLWLNGPERFSLLWPTNGLLFGLLLLSPKRRWSSLFALQFLVSFLVHLLFDRSISAGLAYSLANSLEVALAILPFRQILPGRADFTSPRQLISLLGASLTAPVISGAVAIALLDYPRAGAAAFFRSWWLGDSLGLFLITPLVLMTVRPETREHFRLRRLPATLLTLAIAAVPNLLLSVPQRIPLLFLDFPLLVFVAFRLGLFGAAIGALLMVIPMTHFAISASGMFGANVFHDKPTRILVLQAYLLIQLIMVYLVSLALMRQKQLRDELEKSEERYRNLADNSWDVILQMDADGRCIYVSPSLHDALSRSAEEMIGQLACTWVHPEDVARADEMMEALRSGTERQLIQLRMEHKDGGYRWMELKARAVREGSTGEMREVVAIARDVTARVLRDLELTAAVRRAESLALTDELTSLGNRRGFEETLERVWNKAVEDGESIAVLMIDADNFKAFNDLNGHLAGDECLQRLARLIRQCVRRPADYAARYGGEEFAVILPAADHETAESIAERIRFSIANSDLLRAGSSPVVVTVSIGVAQRAATSGHSPRDLLRAADAALYDAKRAGRNCIRSRR